MHWRLRQAPDPVRIAQFFSLRSLSYIAFFFGVAQLFIGLSSDNKSLLNLSAQLLQHGNIYTYEYEVNPPLILLLYTPAAAAIHWLSAPPAFAMRLYALMLALVSYREIGRVLIASSLLPAWQTRMRAASLFVLFILPASLEVFGDREHLFFILSLPWLMQMLWGMRPTLRTMLPAAIGACIKHYNIVIPLLLMLFTRTLGQGFFARLKSPSVVLFCAVGVTYIALVWFCFAPYIQHIVPMVMTAYEGMHFPLEYRVMWFLFFAALMGLLFYTARPRTEDLRGFRLFATGCGICFLLNGGWSYTFYLLGVAMCITALRVLPIYSGVFPWRRIWRTRARWVMIAPSVALLLIWAGQSCTQLYKSIYDTAQTGYGTSYFALPPGYEKQLRDAAGKEFILLSDTLYGCIIADYAGEHTHVFDFDVLWPFPWLYHHPEDSRAPAIKQVVVDRIIRAMERHPDAAVLIDRSPYFRGFITWDVDLLEFFERDHPELTRAMEHYQVDTVIDRCAPPNGIAFCRIEVWKRTPAPVGKKNAQP